ncbi:MAG: hypothetical protein ABJA93_10625 [Sporichthyaceae bacterium]
MARDNDVTNDRGAVRSDGTADDDYTVRTDPARNTTRTDGTRNGVVGTNDEVDLRSRERRAEVARDHVHRQHEFYGGFKWGAAFFGWLSANGLTVLLVAIASAAGVALGLTQDSTDKANANAETVGLAGAIVLLVIIALGYYAGGYVAGRMARFDGARQGVGVWIIGLLVTAALAVAGVAFGAKYNVLNQLNLPRIPVDEGDATTAGIIALVAVLVVTLLAAVAGGKVGERYHRRVDRAGIDA